MGAATRFWSSCWSSRRALVENIEDVEDAVEEPEDGEGDPSELSREKPLNVWDRIRNASQMEKILLAVKADRSERSMLLQDNDPRVLLSLLRNPRLTVDEVVRLAKSTFLNVPDCGRHHEERPVDGQSRRPPGPHPQRQDPAGIRAAHSSDPPG